MEFVVFGGVAKEEHRVLLDEAPIGRELRWLNGKRKFFLQLAQSGLPQDITHRAVENLEVIERAITEFKLRQTLGKM